MQSGTLLHAHSQDSKDVGLIADFACPICGRSISSDTFDTELSLGHAWPEALRKDSSELSRFTVLVCRYCNNTAGSRGDVHMQNALLHEQGAKSGKLLGERRLQLIENSKPPIKLNAQVFMKHNEQGDFEGSITFSAKRNNPIDIDAFRRLSTDQTVFSLIVSPPHPQIRPDLATAGWVTSAFLMGFYTLGYRYIVSPHLDPVRKYICDSFSSNEIELPDGVEVGRYKNNISTDKPIVEINIPLKPQDALTLKVRYLDIVVTLPFHFDPTALSIFLKTFTPDIYDQEGHIRADFDEGTFLGIIVNCTKTRVHRCIWDYVLGFRPE